MKELKKLKEMEQLFNNLSDKNKDVLILVANSLKVAQNIKLEDIRNVNK